MARNRFGGGTADFIVVRQGAYYGRPTLPVTLTFWSGTPDDTGRVKYDDLRLVSDPATPVSSITPTDPADWPEFDGPDDGATALWASADGGATGNWITATSLSAAFAAKARASATPPLPLAAVTIAPEDLARPVENLGGYLWGYGSSTAAYRSADNGVTWVTWATMPVGQLQRIIPTSGGGAVVVTSERVYKSPNWFDGPDPTMVEKIAVNGGARNTRFGVDGDGTKVIVSEYGPGTANFADSRYAHISLDAGETWVTAWDSDVQTTNLAADSHVHGCCYDSWEDTFYVIEGHSTDAGVWRSTDDGATWVLNDGYRASSAPTCCVATDDGLVLTSDDPNSGLWGIPRVGPADKRAIVRTWDWREGYDGVIGFGQHAARDPETGIVYAAYQSSFADVAPIIVGGTATVGGLVWEWPIADLPVLAGDEIQTLVLGRDGKVMAAAFVNGARHIITGYRSTHGQSETNDPGGYRGGTAQKGSSAAVGAKSSTADAIRATAFGVRAKAEWQDGTAIGFESSVGAVSSVAIGASATAPAADGTVVGKDATVPFGQSVAIGKGASTNTGGSAVAVGWTAAARTNGTAVGAASVVKGSAGTALGQGANVAAGHTNSVALGKGVTTTAANQVEVGAKHLELTEVAAPGLAPADGARLYVRDDGAGKTQLVVIFQSGAEIVLATEA